MSFQVIVHLILSEGDRISCLDGLLNLSHLRLTSLLRKGIGRRRKRRRKKEKENYIYKVDNNKKEDVEEEKLEE